MLRCYVSSINVELAGTGTTNLDHDIEIVGITGVTVVYLWGATSGAGPTSQAINDAVCTALAGDRLVTPCVKITIEDSSIVFSTISVGANNHYPFSGPCSPL